jgi:hypothetical protein
MEMPGWSWMLLVLLLGGQHLERSGIAEDHAEPAVASQVHSPLAQVKIWFTERLEPALSKIQVFDASGQQVDKGDVQEINPMRHYCRYRSERYNPENTGLSGASCQLTRTLQRAISRLK